jgi:hypothetical protein
MGHRCAVGERHDGVGDAQIEVLVAVDLDGLVEARLQLADHHANGLGRAPPEGVGQSEGIHMAVGGHLVDQVHVTVQVRAGAVDGEEHRVQPGLLGGKRGLDGRLNGPLHRLAVGVLNDVVARRNLGDDALYPAVFGELDVLWHAAGERENLGLQTQGNNVADGRFVFGRNGRHAGFNSVHSGFGQSFCDGHLLIPAKGDSVCCSPSRKVTSWIRMFSGKWRLSRTSGSQFQGLVNHWSVFHG